jgi:imidazolonepropionase-like amidohydrolase
MHAPFPADMKGLDRLKALADMDLTSPEALKALEFLKAHHTVVDPTLALMEFFGASTAKPTASFEPGVLKVPVELSGPLVDVGPPSPYADLLEKRFQKEMAIVGLLHKAGIPIVAGTDQAVPGHSLHRELELYVQAGFTPMEAIQAATIVPARAMGMDKELGTVEAGKRADLIVIQGDPLEKINNTRNVEYVITNGVMYNAAELWKSVGFLP